MKDFLEIDTATNAIDSLLRAEEFIRRVESEGNPLLWKWIIICLHHSLYTFSIIVAAGTNRINVAVFNKKHMKKMFVEYEDEDEDETTGKKTYQPDYGWIADNIYSVKLVDFLTAVKRACAANPFIHSRPLELTGNQKNSILYLRDYRNSLEHFEPKNHLGIGLHGLLNICVEILETIRCLALPSNRPLGPVEKLDVLKKMEKSSSPEEKNFFSPSHGTGPGEARSKKDRVEESINASIGILRSFGSHYQNCEIPDHPRLSEWTEE